MLLRNKRFRRVIAILLIISLVVALVMIKPSSADSEVTLKATTDTVELNRVDAGTVTIEVKVPTTGMYSAFTSYWSLHETTASGESTGTEYITLQSHEISSLPEETSDYYNNTIGTEGKAMWYDSSSDGTTGLELQAGDTIWKATYKIDADTPVGTYYIKNRKIQIMGHEYNSASGNYVNGTEIDYGNESVLTLVTAIKVTKAKLAVTPVISGYDESYTYTGSQITPEITVTTDTSIVLEKDTDYTVTYGTNLVAGESNGSITINPVASSEYAFEETTVNFNIDKAPSTEEALNATLASYGGIKVPIGTKLSELEGLLQVTLGNPGITLAAFGIHLIPGTENTVITAGENEYQVLYVQDIVGTNYNATPVNAKIYGLSFVNMNTSVEGGNGSISESESNVLEGTTKVFTLTPDEGYKVAKVTVNGTQVPVTDNTVTVTAGPVNMAIVATFKPQVEELTIVGMEDNQEITYTGRPVVLEGNLAVEENEGHITVSDLTETYYQFVALDGGLGEEVLLEEAPTDVGAYKVVYSYEDEDYEGELIILFEIVKADSVVPAGVVEAVQQYLRVPAGTTLGDIPIGNYSSIVGGIVAWVDEEAVVAPGTAMYSVTYETLEVGKTGNYNPVQVQVPVYGLSLIKIETEVDGEGGTVTETLENVLEDTEKTITFTPEDGYKVGKVTVNGEEVTVTNNQITVTAMNEDMKVVVKFEKLPITYNYLEGSGQTYTKGTDGTATFRVDADFSLFDSVYVDNKLVDASNYTAKSGSTVITFTKAFMEGLTAGNHTLEVRYTNGGVAATTFTVAAAETTTENTVVNTDTTSTATETTTGTAATTTTTTTTTSSSTPKTGDKILVDIYIAIVSGLAIFMIIDHKLNSKPRKSVRRRK